MLKVILLTAACCCIPGLVLAYLAVRWAWLEGYQDGVADARLGLNDALNLALRPLPKQPDPP